MQTFDWTKCTVLSLCCYIQLCFKQYVPTLLIKLFYYYIFTESFDSTYMFTHCYKIKLWLYLTYNFDLTCMYTYCSRIILSLHLISLTRMCWIILSVLKQSLHFSWPVLSCCSVSQLCSKLLISYFDSCSPDCTWSASYPLSFRCTSYGTSRSIILSLFFLVLCFLFTICQNDTPLPQWPSDSDIKQYAYNIPTIWAC